MRSTSKARMVICAAILFVVAGCSTSPEPQPPGPDTTDSISLPAASLPSNYTWSTVTEASVKVPVPPQWRENDVSAPQFSASAKPALEKKGIDSKQAESNKAVYVSAQGDSLNVTVTDGQIQLTAEAMRDTITTSMSKNGDTIEGLNVKTRPTRFGEAIEASFTKKASGNQSKDTYARTLTFGNHGKTVGISVTSTDSSTTRTVADSVFANVSPA